MDLQRFLDEVRAALPSERVLPAEAGLSSVAAPAAVAGPAQCVVWWDFSRASAPTSGRVPFTVAERSQLEAAGVTWVSVGFPTPNRGAYQETLARFAETFVSG